VNQWVKFLTAATVAVSGKSPKIGKKQFPGRFWVSISRNSLKYSFCVVSHVVSNAQYHKYAIVLLIRTLSILKTSSFTTVISLLDIMTHAYQYVVR